MVCMLHPELCVGVVVNKMAGLCGDDIISCDVIACDKRKDLNISYKKSTACSFFFTRIYDESCETDWKYL